jgi:hypothetical protein
MDRLTVARSAACQALYQLCEWVTENEDSLLWTKETANDMHLLLDVLECARNGIEGLHAAIYEADARFTWNIAQEARMGFQNDQPVRGAGRSGERGSTG